MVNYSKLTHITYVFPLDYACFIRDMGHYGNSVECGIDCILSEIMANWGEQIVDRWNERYLKTPQDIDEIRDTAIEFIDLKTVAKFVNDVYVITGGSFNRGIIFHELMRVICEWEKMLFEEWKVRTLEEASADGLQCKEYRR